MSAGERGVVIVGAGHGGFQTASALRHAGFEGRIVLVDTQAGLPYQRPPLSKGFLSGSVKAESLWFGSEDFYRRQRVDLLDGERVIAVDRPSARVELASGNSIPYDHLVLAMGASARRLPGLDADGVVSLRTLADAEDLRARLTSVKAVVVVGGGFIGLEFSAVAASLGVEVTVVEALPDLMSRVLTAESSAFCAGEHMRKGVRVCTRSRISRLHKSQGGSVTAVEIDDGRRFPSDLVVFAIGIVPNVDLASESGLALDDGIVVDEYLRTEDPRVSAIGDCSRYPSPFAKGTLRLESVQNAADHARCVAARLVGKASPYVDVPWFWSDQYDIKLQIAGLTGDHDQCVVVGDRDAGSFSVLCFAGRRFLGAESFNRPADHLSARRLLSPTVPYHARLTPELLANPEFDLKAYAKAATGDRGPTP